MRMQAGDPSVGIREKKRHMAMAQGDLARPSSAAPIGTNMNESEKVSAVLPTDLHTQLVERAREEDRSVSAQLRVAVREHVEPQPANGKREPKEKKR